MARTRTTFNDRGMRQLLRDKGIVRDLTTRMERVLSTAKANAPVLTGAYRDGLHMEQVKHPSRVVVRVVGDTDHDLIVEANTGNLGRSLDQAKGG